MKIGLVSSLMKDNDIEHQLLQMEHYVSECKNCDLVCFGESFLQGFEGLTWKYEWDIKRALSQDDEVILHIRLLAKSHNCGLSFGFIEKDNGFLYSSNLIIDAQGEIVDIYRRVSPGWKVPGADHRYKEGEGSHQFSYNGKIMGVAICGDIWHDNFLREMEQNRLDALLWPLYVDYAIDEWEESIQKEYAQRTQDLPCPVLMINSYAEGPERAKGGLYVFYRNEVLASMPMGRKGVLQFEL